MSILTWAREIKPDLVRLQAETRIPALFAAAQFCQESYDRDKPDELSDLARLHYNYAGLKFASWQLQFNCQSVDMRTNEVLNGASVSLDAAFCSCQNNGGWQTWLKVYASLLTGSYYGPALGSAADPMLYAAQVWRRGWATDPAYLTGISTWMVQLLPYYAETLPAVLPALGRPVAVLDAAGRRLCEGWLQDPDGPGPEPDRAVVRIRDIAEAQGLGVEYDSGGPSVYLRWPGASNNK